MATFAEWFGRQLTRREWNQADFVAASGVPSATVSTWVRGARVPDSASCRKIAETFRVDLDTVLVVAGHRENVEERDPDDQAELLAQELRRVRWTNPARREALRVMLEYWRAEDEQFGQTVSFPTTHQSAGLSITGNHGRGE